MMGTLFGGVMSASYLVMVKTTHEPLRPSAALPGKFWGEAKAVLRAPGFLPLLLLFVTATLGMGTLSSILPFFLASYLRLAAGLQTALLALLFITAALSVPLWTRLSAWWGKRGGVC